MNTTLSLDAIYKMLSTLSTSNKKWLADHLYADIYAQTNLRSKEQLIADMESALQEAKSFKKGTVQLKTAESLLNEL